MQTPRRFKYVVRFLGGPGSSCSLPTSGAGTSLKVTRRITSLTPLKGVLLPSLKITMQILLSGPRSGNVGLGFQRVYHLWTYALHPVPRAKPFPPLLHDQLILCVWALWFVVLPHRNKQMATPS